jgi:hypothetical protein
MPAEEVRPRAFQPFNAILAGLAVAVPGAEKIRPAMTETSGANHGDGFPNFLPATRTAEAIAENEALPFSGKGDPGVGSAMAHPLPIAYASWH